ncbi:hypothetical protein D3C73_1158760 [compost metagenome]
MGHQIDVIRVLGQPARIDGDGAGLVLVADESDAGVRRIDHDAHFVRRGRAEVRTLAQVGEVERIDDALAHRRGQRAGSILVIQRYPVTADLAIKGLGLRLCLAETWKYKGSKNEGENT